MCFVVKLCSKKNEKTLEAILAGGQLIENIYYYIKKRIVLI